MTPVEEDRALDGEDLALGDGRRGREAMDPATKHLAMMAGGVGLLLAVVIGGWALSGRNPGSVPVIQPPPGLVRVKPINPGGMQGMDAQGPLSPGNGGPETLAPQTETADPRALQAEVEAARRRAQATQDASPTTPAANPSAAAPSLAASGQPAPPVSSPDQPPQPQARTAPTGGAAASSAGAPQAAAAPPVVRERAEEGVKHGRAMVQLAALGTHAAAEGEWSRLRHAHPGLLSGRSAQIEPAQHSGHTIYRLRTGGFDGLGAAAAFCNQARSQKVACTVADF